MVCDVCIGGVGRVNHNFYHHLISSHLISCLFHSPPSLSCPNAFAIAFNVTHNNLTSSQPIPSHHYTLSFLSATFSLHSPPSPSSPPYLAPTPSRSLSTSHRRVLGRCLHWGVCLCVGEMWGGVGECECVVMRWDGLGRGEVVVCDVKSDRKGIGTG